MGGCPFHGGEGSDESSDSDPDPTDVRQRTIDRRDFVRTALAIGGTGALATLTGYAGNAGESPEELGTLDVDRGPRDPTTFPERQHAWNADLQKDPFGNPVLPNHQVLLFLDYRGSGVPTHRERRRVERALRTLERGLQRLAGGDPTADNEGLVFMIGYTPRYFDRFDEELPAGIDLQTPETVLRKTNDDPGKADTFDALVVLSSDAVPVLLAAEAVLFGELDAVNGVRPPGTLDGIFERSERRTGFVGRGMPRDRLDTEDVPEASPLSMGYKSGFEDALAGEDRVTITETAFAQGTTMQVSKLRLDLDAWYDNDRETRDELMFSHAHSREDIGVVGETLEDDSGITPEIADEVESQAERHGRVGHAAKTAQARDDDFEPLILRRSEGVNDAFHEEGRVDFNFTAVMEGIQDFVETRRAMDASHLDDHVDPGQHGILPYTTVTNRATVLIPPRRWRSLPTPTPGP